MRRLSVASGLYLSLNVTFVLHKKYVETIINDEGISVCFQKKFLGFFCQSRELRTDTAVSPPEQEISAAFSLVDFSCYAIFLDMASVGHFPVYFSVDLLFISSLVRWEHLTVRLPGSYHLPWEDGFFWLWLIAWQ